VRWRGRVPPVYIMSAMLRRISDNRIAAAQKPLSRHHFLRLGGLGLGGILIGAGFGAQEPVSVSRAAAPAKFEPREGLLYTGVSLTRPKDFCVERAVKRWNNWTRLMQGKPAAISHEFTWFNNQGLYAYDFARARKATPMISIEFTKASTKEIANAGRSEDGRRTDLLILRHADAAREYRDKVFVRLGHEMNGYWYSYCAYDEDGTPRANTSEDYTLAWRRFVTIFRGGHVRDIDARLAGYGLPPLHRGADPPTYMGNRSLDDPDAYIPPVENVAFVWCPNVVSLPDVAGNAAIEYYPGDDIVDWVGQDAYYAPWPTSRWSRYRHLDILDHLNDFYREFSEWRGKPYMLAEWALRPPSMGPKGTTTNDHPDFISRVLDWTNTRPEAKALVYWSWYYPPEGDYRLQAFPESAKTLAEGWKDPRFLSGGTAPKITEPVCP
jgi:hypothetical protein